MEFFHHDLLRLSVQQRPRGRLPEGLVQELTETTQLAHKFISLLGANTAHYLDQKVYGDPQFFCDETIRKATQLNLYSKWLPKALGGEGFHPLSMYSFNFEMAACAISGSHNLNAAFSVIRRGGGVSGYAQLIVYQRIFSDGR